MRGTAAPTRPEDRHHLIDALRGFALAGVLLANLGYLSLYELMTEPARAALPTAAFDAWALAAMHWLVNVKAITVFSLLFGLGFALQLERAQQRGGGGLGRFAWRLFWLLVIGLLHSYFLWWGDILMSYALIGLLLMAFRRARDGVLLWTGLFVALLLPGLLGPWMRGWMEDLPARADIYALGLQGFLSSSWVQTFQANAAIVSWTRLSNWTLICFVLGRFLLGYWAGRKQLLQRPQDHLPLLRWLWWGGLAVAIASALLPDVLAPATAAPDRLDPIRLLHGLLSRLEPLAQGIAYAAGFALLFLRPRGARVLGMLAPVGRMALTHYLLQSAAGIALFYGIGLGIGPDTGVTGWWLAWAGIFAAQILVSHWWLARFRYGPCEWAWRSLTYGELQPMRLPRAALAS